MKVCFYSPYFPNHFGGGERHVLDIATHLPPQMEATIAFPKREGEEINVAELRTRYEKFYGAALAKITFSRCPINTSANFLQKLLWTKQFSDLFVVSDGSLFFSLARKNIAHLQIPFTNRFDGVFNRVKLQQWQLNTNSHFTKTVIEAHWRCQVASVLQPMVDSALFSLPNKKEKIILHVGRFFTQLHSKRQDVLVENFRQLLLTHPEFRSWRLELVGGVEDAQYFQKIKRASLGLPITLHTDCSRAELLELYSKASIYWHATGFAVDEKLQPEKVEHFGITTLEAMAAGAVPVVVAKGGQREVLGAELLQLAWESPTACITQTKKLLENQTLLQHYQQLAKERAVAFGEARFTKQVAAIFSNT